MFRRASKAQSRLRFAIMGPPGSGKTYTALNLAKHMGGTTAVVDTEHGSSEKYANLFDFDVCQLTSFHPSSYLEAIKAAGEAGYNNLIIDSMSHLWSGKEGVLEQVDKLAKRNGGNSFSSWKDINPMLYKVIEAILSSPCNVICSFRTKVDYIIEENERGKKVPKKVGLAPVFKSEMEYEFDVVAEMNQENEMIVSKSRCPELAGQVISKPGSEVAEMLQGWLNSGAPAKPKIDRDAVLSQSGTLLSELGWTSEDGKKHLKATYNKASRQFLTDDELTDFVSYLSAQLEAKSESEESIETQPSEVTA